MKFNRENRGCRFIFPPFLFFSRSVIYLFHSMSPEVPRPFITNTNSNSFFSVLLRGPVQYIYIYIFLDKIWCIRVRVLFRRWIARFSRGTWIISNEIRSTEYIFFSTSWLNLCLEYCTNTCVNIRTLKTIIRTVKILVWLKFVLRSVFRVDEIEIGRIRVISSARV